MITLSNGHSFEYMTASGALAFDGRGWWWNKPLHSAGLIDSRLFTNVIKTVTRQPIKGEYRWWNPTRCLRFIKNGTVNAVRLSNPGIEAWCEKHGPTIEKLNSRGVAMVGSILANDPRELASLAVRMEEFPFKALELNFSCPNTEEEVGANAELVVRGSESVRNAVTLPLIGKLSVSHDSKWILPRVAGILEALSINSVPWNIAFPGRKSPLAHLGGGGVSGAAAQRENWTFAQRLTLQLDIPVIWPSVWWYEDIDKLWNTYRAPAISFGAVAIPSWKRPLAATLPTRWVKRQRREKAMLEAASTPWLP